MYINDAECRAAGYSGDDIKKIKSIARRLSKAAEEASLLNIKVFGGSGGGTLRSMSQDTDGQLILAVLDGNFDGGIGDTHQDDDGLWVGE